MSPLLVALVLSASCDPSALQAGEHEIVVDGVKRSYLARPPTTKGASAKPGKAPLVFLWHGWGGAAENQLKLAPFEDAYLISARGLPRRFPRLGERALPGWQLRVGEFDDRDLKLYDALLARAKASGCVDEDRVTSTGFSNGGFFTNLLGCVRGQTLAAVAPVGGGGPFEDECGPPIPALLVHGTKDRVVELARAEKSLERYRARARCGPASFVLGCQSIAGCRTEVQSCAFPGGHRFPPEMRAEVERFLSSKARAKKR